MARVPCLLPSTTPPCGLMLLSLAGLNWTWWSWARLPALIMKFWTPPSTITHRKEERKYPHFHHGVCRKTFLFLHGIGEFRFKAVKSSYLAGGMVPRVYKRTGPVSHNTPVLGDIHTNYNQVHWTACWGKFHTVTQSHTWLQRTILPQRGLFGGSTRTLLPLSWLGRLHIQQLLATVFTFSESFTFFLREL